ncbi:adhesion G-protein coupled receptor D2 isoform X1 [Amblyraja radiata]|uniref:adhesion G-protein coupled receptor D2 isoform X1 n=1 Tax=Amblyraja radiata TaxID=386614 RepID=UPI001402CB7D|nr:adhesion G-protein coupled receptor D2 isoform X1 [Amblyraja radiata]
MCGLRLITFGIYAALAWSSDGAHSQAYSHSLDIHSSYYTYEYITTPLKWQHAYKYCELRFGSLPGVSDVEEKSVLLDLLALQGVNQQIWMNGESNVAKRRDETLEGNRHLAVLKFPIKTDTNYARILSVLPSMSAVTACVRLQWDNQTDTIATVFSYAVPMFTNAFQLRGRINDTGFIQLALIVHGHHTAYRTALRSDGQWHHICVTWRTEKGAWSFYADGQEVSSGEGCHSSKLLAGNGTFIIGQEQDALGGAFKQNEAFSGNITDLNIWSQALDGSQIAAVSGCSPPLQQHLAYRWNVTSLELTSVEVGEVHLKCSAANVSSAECRTFDAVSGVESRLDCELPLPFICQFNKDTYLKLKKFELDPRSSFNAKLNEFSKNVTVTDYMLLSGVKLVPNVSEAEAVLKAVQHALSAENATLQAADLLGVINMLQNVAGMEVDASEPREGLEDMSRSFIDVAADILDQSNTESWNEISEIVPGPMTVVYGVDRMMQNMNKVFAFGQKTLIIRNKNIQLEIRPKQLNDFANGFNVYMGDGINKSSDQIGLSKEAVERLQRKGLTATLVNIWYLTVPNLLGSSPLDMGGLVNTGFDEGLIHVSTQVASALISSTVFQGGQEVNTPTQYRLLHRIKAIPSLIVHPLCAFWNFSRKPGTGGSWSTHGCSIVQSDRQSTTCFCNHTTNFALLFQIYETKQSSYEEAVLMKLTLTGCSVSLCAMVTTLIVFAVLEVPNSDRTTVHKNLIGALIAAETLLLASESARTHRVACWVVTALLHLFFMAAFGWMLVEGILLWSKVIAVNISEGRRMKYYYLIGWGFPVFIVVITVATTSDRYIADNHCWLNIKGNVIWAFVGPVLFTLTFNAFVLCRVVVITVSSFQRRSVMLVSGASLPHRVYSQTWAAIKPVAILLPVLGLTWFCGVLVHLDITLGYIFVVLNSFQGLYIFLVYTLYNSEVRNAIKRMREKKKALSFKNCTSLRPSSCLAAPRMTTALNAGNCCSPPAEKNIPTPANSCNKSVISEGKTNTSSELPGAEGLTCFSPGMAPDKQDCEASTLPYHQREAPSHWVALWSICVQRPNDNLWKLDLQASLCSGDGL